MASSCNSIVVGQMKTCAIAPPSTCISSQRRPPASTSIITGGKAPGIAADASIRSRKSASVRSTIALSAGGSGSSALRSLFSGPERLNYNLFLNSAFTNIWGDGTAGSRVGTANPNIPAGQSRTANRTIYGRIPALQSPAAGAFGDMIVVTVTY
jgi:spore coat protein U-like protein